MSAALVSAWLVVVNAATGQAIIQKQVRIEHKDCHKVIRGEFPLNGTWVKAKVYARCEK